MAQHTETRIPKFRYFIAVRSAHNSRTDANVQELIQAACAVRKNAYCPYSKFAVGAALRLANGSIVTGCNVENATFGPTICAERTAVAHAVSRGEREFTACAVVAFQETQFTAPCGLCRQTLAEFCGKNLPVYMAKPAPVRVLCTTLGELLPFAFEPTFVEPRSTPADATNRN